MICLKEETNVLGNKSGKRSGKGEKQAETRLPKEFLQLYGESLSLEREGNRKASCHIDDHHSKTNEQVAKAARETPLESASPDQTCSLTPAHI